MRCPHCGKDGLAVVDTKPHPDYWVIRRRRMCMACTRRVTTFEVLEDDFEVIRVLRRVRDPRANADDN